MCMIIDTNQWGDFIKETTDMRPIHKWLKKGNGRLLYSDYGNFKNEIKPKQRIRLQELKERGGAKFIAKEDVKTAVAQIKNKHKLKSNDISILALAVAGHARLLCSHDQALCRDFKSIIKGKIYKRQKHTKLLNKNACPG